MFGDVADFVGRLRRVLPPRWFGDTSPSAGALLSGFAVAWSAIYGLIAAVRAQARLATSSGVFIDTFSRDFFGLLLPRGSGESDASFVARLHFELLRPRGTRQALVTALVELTGQQAVVFEPARPADTGGYSVGAVGYNCGGAWGSLTLAYQSFVKVRRPHGAGIAQLAGYRTGGALAYGSLRMVARAVSDADIYKSAAAILPAGYTAWIQIQG